MLRDAVWAAAADMARRRQRLPAHPRASRAAIRRASIGRAPGAPIVPARPGRPGAAARGSQSAPSIALDRSWLVIQGPPGAGKTYTTSHLIAVARRAGKTVGIASNSHKAIDNVLHAVEDRLQEAGEPKARLGQKKDGRRDGYKGRGFIESSHGQRQDRSDLPIIGGTAWLFARDRSCAASRDVLFVDEAGQVSLGNLVAMATAAKSIVLVGRPDAARPADPGCASPRQRPVGA